MPTRSLRFDLAAGDLLMHVVRWRSFPEGGMYVFRKVGTNLLREFGDDVKTIRTWDIIKTLFHVVRKAVIGSGVF